MAATDELNRLTRGDLGRAKAAAPAHYQPIFDAVDRGRLAVLFLRPETRARNPGAIIDDRPSLIVIGDDAEGGSRGPGAFDRKTLERAGRRACNVMIHSAAGDPAHYAMIVVAALLMPTMSSLIIETTPRHHADWKAWVEKRAAQAAVLHIVPPDAGHA